MNALASHSLFCFPLDGELREGGDGVSILIIQSSDNRGAEIAIRFWINNMDSGASLPGFIPQVPYLRTVLDTH